MNSCNDTHVNQLLRATGQTPALLALVSALDGNLFLVGGAVRECLIGEEPKELDVATPLSVTEVQERLNAKGIKVVETGLKHGTVTAVFDGMHVEITSFRGEKNGPLEKRLESDLSLRDFTINAIAYSIAEEKLFDPLNGLGDLNKKIVRAPSPAINRFQEDPLRVMRMIRFGPARGFDVEPSTLEASKELVSLINKVSPERIQNELCRILLDPFPANAFRMMLEIGLIKEIIPEMLPSVGFEQNDFHVESVFDHTLSVIDRTPPDLMLRLCGLFHDLGKPHTLSIGDDGRRHFYEHEIVSTEITKEVMKRLKFSNDSIDTVSNLVRYHMRHTEVGPSGVRRLLRDLGDKFPRWRKFKEADAPPAINMQETLGELDKFDELVQAEKTRQEIENLKKLVIGGHDLMTLGVKPGPSMGKIIKTLEEEVIEEPSRNNREYLLQRASELIKDF